MTRPNSQRLSIVLPHTVDQRLREMAEREGRSISNLAAHLIREALEGWERDGRSQQ